MAKTIILFPIKLIVKVVLNIAAAIFNAIATVMFSASTISGCIATIVSGGAFVFVLIKFAYTKFAEFDFKLALWCFIIILVPFLMRLISDGAVKISDFLSDKASDIDLI